MRVINVCLLVLILCTLRINCTDDWSGRWFPYNPSEIPDLPPADVEIALKNCDPSQPGCAYNSNEKDEEWNGKWFPGKDDKVEMTHSREHVQMGFVEECDDGESQLEVDYDGNPMNYTCYEDKHLYLPNPMVHPLHEKEEIPPKYTSIHKCMNETLTYSTKFPTFGPHRPNWPKFGEYSFVPIQRWLHTIEHGGVVMLYHPCANKNQVKSLKHIVRNCLFRHVISANRDLTPERPLVLLTWGHRLFMSKVDENTVVKFIKKHAGKAPEYIAVDGTYKLLLKKPAKLISGEYDEDFCPSN